MRDVTYEGAVQDLIDELGRLPGIGPKSAQRIAFHLLNADREDAERLADAIVRVKETIRSCAVCFHIAEQERCRICRDARRDASLVCVVEEPRDVLAVERTQEYRGRYHVLGGAISPIDGVGPDDLHFDALERRLDEDGIDEVIIATNPNVEGEATASYLTKLLKDRPITVSRLASGLPVGGDLDYADEVTLGRAFSGRQQVEP